MARRPSMEEELARGGNSSEMERDETPAERLDRNFNEMLGGLRVALPGVQVLFAFLLTVPFSQGFASISQFQRVLYLGVLLATALASFLLITDYLFGAAVAIPITAVAGLVIASLWYVLPWARGR